MKKYFMMALMVLATFSLSSCGDDDEPVVTDVQSNQMSLYFGTPNVLNLTNVKVCQNYNGFHIQVDVQKAENDFANIYADFGPETIGHTYNLADPSGYPSAEMNFTLFRMSPDLMDFLAVDFAPLYSSAEYAHRESYNAPETCFEKGHLTVSHDDKGFHLEIDGVTKHHSVAGAPIVCKLKIDVPESEIIPTF